MTKDNDKLSFFENIYYWLWHISPPETKYWHRTKADFSCIIFSLLRIINILWIISFLSFLLKRNLLKDYLGGSTSKGIILITIVPIFFILIWYDERRYEKRADFIVKKMEKLVKEEKVKTIYIFLLYLIVSLGSLYFLPYFVASYTQN